MANGPLLPPSELRQLLRYEPEAGRLYWLDRYEGREALSSVDRHGHRRGRILGNQYQAHRVVWALAYGEWPTGDIDHINGDRGDNRLSNLRAVSHRDNQCNQRRNANNTSGVTGVTWKSDRKRWAAFIYHPPGHYVHLGTFTSLEAAASARNQAALDFGYHPNHGRD